MITKKMPKGFAEWVEDVHMSVKSSPLWQFQVYQKALFVYDLTWEDCEYLFKDRREETVAKQLIRCVGSISANIEEGYGRGYGKDYAYRLRIALGEAREAQGWYWRAHNLIPEHVLDHRLALLNEITAMLIPVINQQSKHKK